MLVNDYVHAFYNFDKIEFLNEFKVEFNKILDESSDNKGYRLYFSSYDDYKVTTEIVFCIVYAETVLFFVSPIKLVVNVDAQLLVTDGGLVTDIDTETIFDQINDGNTPSEIYVNTNSIFDIFSDGSMPSIVYLNDCCNSYGYAFDIFTINKQSNIESAIKILDDELYNCDEFYIDENELMVVALDYLQERIELYKEEIENSIEAEEASVNLNDNPYANDYYDYDENNATKRNSPMIKARTLTKGIDDESI